MGALIINTNAQALNTHRNLMKVDRQMQTTLEHLSSGMKVNRAADGPATLMISEQMRAQIASVRQAIDNSETSVSMVQTTEAALDEVNKMLTIFTDANVDFTGSVAPGDRVTTTGRVKFFRRKKLRASVEMALDDGTIVCSGELSGMGVPR